VTTKSKTQELAHALGEEWAGVLKPTRDVAAALLLRQESTIAEQTAEIERLRAALHVAADRLEVRGHNMGAREAHAALDNKA